MPVDSTRPAIGFATSIGALGDHGAVVVNVPAEPWPARVCTVISPVAGNATRPRISRSSQVSTTKPFAPTEPANATTPVPVAGPKLAPSIVTCVPHGPVCGASADTIGAGGSGGSLAPPHAASAKSHGRMDLTWGNLAEIARGYEDGRAGPRARAASASGASAAAGSRTGCRPLTEHLARTDTEVQENLIAGARGWRRLIRWISPCRPPSRSAR